MTTPAVISLTDITKVYDTGEIQVHALRGVNLEILSGEFVAIMGASGTGKSTLLNILGCLDHPTEGSFLLDGVPVHTLNRDQMADIRNSKIGFVFQSFNLLQRTTAQENVLVPLLYNRREKIDDMKERATTALTRVGLGERIFSHPNQLSGGQQQRVAIARAMVNKPSLILADEPTGNLDSRTSLEILALFQDLNRQGVTVIMVTHEPDVAQYTKRIIEMKDGRILREAASPFPGCRRRAQETACRGGVMRSANLFRIAYQSIIKHKMRTLLTMLGIIIGVGAVIVMVAIGQGAQASIQGRSTALERTWSLSFLGSSAKPESPWEGGPSPGSPSTMWRS